MGQDGSDEAPTVLFDGVCNLCNGSVQFILDHERDHTLRFASLQSDEGARLLVAHGRRALAEGEAPESIALVEGGTLYERSTAALRIARHLRAPWRWGVVFFLVPRVLRDLAYGVIARNRYRWFGRSEQCLLPEPRSRSKFIDPG